MPSVAELTAGYANFMLAPRNGPDVCDTCFNLTNGYTRCYACTHNEPQLAAVLPISYSVAHEQLHHALAHYKRSQTPAARRLTVGLAAVLWRHLAQHERCLARAAGVERFDLVTTVPSGNRERDERHPLRRIVGELVGPTRTRYARVLNRGETEIQPRAFNPHKFEPTTQLHGRAVLLVDDTWTTGASAQSAAAALKLAGAETVAAVVIGRHLNRDWHENDRRLRGLPQPFDWDRCALCECDLAV